MTDHLQLQEYIHVQVTFYPTHYHVVAYQNRHMTKDNVKIANYQHDFAPSCVNHTYS